MLLKIHKTSINFLQKTGFSCQFLPNITSNGRMLRQMAVCYMTLVRTESLSYIYTVI